MTSEQIRQALINTVHKPRNDAPVIFQAIRNEKPGYVGRASQIIGQMTITGVTREE